MRCPQCEHENKDGAKFCNECGNKLEVVCPACATLNSPGSKFCNECGASLTEQSKVQGPKPVLSIVEGSKAPSLQPLDARHQTLDPRPVTYTPQHLAERIRAEQAAMEARGAADGE